LPISRTSPANCSPAFWKVMSRKSEAHWQRGIWKRRADWLMAGATAWMYLLRLSISERA